MSGPTPYQRLGADICRAVDIDPNRVSAVTLHIDLHSLPRLTVEMPVADQVDALGRALVQIREFELREIGGQS